MNIKEVQRVVGSIQSHLFKKSNSFSIGMLKSHFRGTGLQFKEHRIYEAGDEVRFIDWKLLAKSNTSYVKTFEEERNVEIVVVIDYMESMLNGFRNVSKLQAAIEICCLLFLLAGKSGDKVNVILMGDKIIDLPGKSGEEGIISLVASLEKNGLIKSDGKVNIRYEHKNQLTDKQKQRAIISHLARRKEVVLLSDFKDFLSIETLRRIVFQSNVHPYRVVSPLDESNTIPYCIHSKSNFGSKKHLVRTNMSGMEEIRSIFGKNIKTLKLEDRYLEKFVKEML